MNRVLFFRLWRTWNITT